MKLRLIFLISLILASIFVISGFLKKSQKEDIQNLSNEISDSINLVYKSTLNTYKLTTQNEFHNLMDNKKALEILKNFKYANKNEQVLLREELYELFLNYYNYLKTLDVRQFHFHTHTGKSLLRFHIPYSNDDSLFETRFSIKIANTKFKSVYGFEGGKIYDGFRYVYPIIDNNEHLGSVEYSISFEAIEKMMKEIFPKYKYHLHVDKTVSYDKVFKSHRNNFETSIFGKGHYIENKVISSISNKMNDDETVKKINKALLLDHNFSDIFSKKENFNFPILLKENSFIVSFISIKDTTNKHAAYLVAYIPSDEILAINNKYDVFYILFYFIIGVVFILAYIINYQIEKIIKQKKRLEKTNINQLETITKQKNELETIFNTTNDGIIIIDFKSNFLFFNKAYKNITGFTQNELRRKTWLDLLNDKEKDKFIDILKELKRIEHIENFENLINVKNNKKIKLNLSMTLMPGKKRVLLSGKDITESYKKEKLIHDYMQLIDKNIITSSTDLKGKITFVSDAFCRTTGYTKDELIGKNHNIVSDKNTAKKIYEDLWTTISNNRTWKGELKNRRKNGTFYWVEQTISSIYNEHNEKIGYTAINQNITNRKRLEELSITDGLTNIYNRRYFNEVFPKMLNIAKRNNEFICFLIMDIDFFKQYNDTYGHQMGDKSLINLANAIKNMCKRADDYCFRLGGEEFGIIYKVKDEKQSVVFANSVRKRIEELLIEHKTSKVSKYLTVSIGVVCQSGKNIATDVEIYKQGDDLLYEAKKNGRNRVYSNLKKSE